MNLYQLLDKLNLNIFLLGIVSGIPMGIIYTTLPVYLTELGTDLAIIGILSLCRLPYAMKFLFVDIITILGYRKAMLISVITLAGSVFSLSKIDPCQAIYSVIAIAFLIVTISTIFDLAHDGYRLKVSITSMEDRLVLDVIGYRLGILISSAGSLYLVQFVQSWNMTFSILSMSILLGIFPILMSKRIEIDDNNLQLYKKSNFLSFFKRNVLSKKMILPFILMLTYKTGECFLATMTLPFCIDIGFSKETIATFIKVSGIFTVIIGSIIAGNFIKKYSDKNVMLIGQIFHIMVTLLFPLLISYQNDLLLFSLFFLDGIASSFTTVALMNYIIKILGGKNQLLAKYSVYSASPYIFNLILASCSGLMAGQTGWDFFFIFCASLMLIPVLIMIYIIK